MAAALLLVGEPARGAPRCRGQKGLPLAARLILAPLLLSPRERPKPAVEQLRARLRRALRRTGRFSVEKLPVSFEQLGREGQRLRPRYWLKFFGRRILKIRQEKDGFSGLFFRPDKRKAIGSWRIHRRGAEKPRRFVQRVVDEMLERFTGTRGYWSTRVAFVRGRGKSSRVLVMDYDGKHLRQVSPRGHEAVLPAWSPRGELSFTSYLWRNPDLYVYRRGRASRLSKQAGLNTGAAWSPSGDELVLTLTKDGDAELYVIDRRGKLERRLTRSRGIDTSPTWSPDGKQIAFVSTRSGSPQIWVKASSGLGPAQQLTSLGTYNQEPKWCPKPGCPWIAFTHRTDGGIYQIRLVNVLTKVGKRISGRGSNKSPTWAPDGRFVLYSSSLGGLWIVDRDGNCPSRFYGGYAKTPAWSGW